MKKQFAYLIGIGLLNIFLFAGIFTLLQNEKIYNHTLGIISDNYERTGGWDNYEIKKVSKPFHQVKNNNFETWDASIYKCISERMYRPEDDCYGKVRAAFFPLFPVLWRITHASSIGISIINYFLFVISIACLLFFLSDTTLVNKLISFSLLITLPSVIIYYMPYTEALFLFTMTIAVIGILKNKYWLFFAGIFLLSMVRPATVYVYLAILFAEFVILLIHKNFRSFIREIFFKSLPFISGYFCALLFQYNYTGSWTSFIDAQKYWVDGIRVIKGISDWSVEGFGLSVFAIFVVCLPAMLFILYLISSRKKVIASAFIQNIRNYNSEYLLLISAFYFIGIFLFTLLTSGGCLHSLFRYILASPLFYIAITIFMNYIFDKPLRIAVVIFFLLNIILILFLNFIDYGGDRLQFSFFGLYMLMATALFLIIKHKLPWYLQLIILTVLIILNTVWNAYLLNIFFSNGWIFT